MKMILVAALLAGGWYAAGRVSSDDVLAYAHAHRDSAWSERAVYSLGLYYYLHGDYLRCQQILTRQLEDFPSGAHAAEARLRLSDAAERNLDREAARQALEKFLELYPDHPSREIARKRLEVLGGGS